MTEANEKNWHQEDLVCVGDYAFSPPFVPTINQIEDAEMFIFSHPVFFELEEGQRRRNVIRLAIDAASAEQSLPVEENSRHISVIPLIGDVVVNVISARHEGIVVRSFEVQDTAEE